MTGKKEFTMREGADLRRKYQLGESRFCSPQRRCGRLAVLCCAVLCGVCVLGVYGMCWFVGICSLALSVLRFGAVAWTSPFGVSSSSLPVQFIWK